MVHITLMKAGTHFIKVTIIFTNNSLESNEAGSVVNFYKQTMSTHTCS